MMEFLLKLSVIWVSASIIVISTVWYLAVTIPQHWPDWWRRVVVDSDPYYPHN